MSILRVAQMGHPVLREPCDPVEPETVLTPDFQSFCANLLETMFEYDGLGLAAPQVHVLLRVVVLVLSDDRGPEFLINPVITPLTTETKRTYEGCLSVEGLRGAVDRPRHVRVEALNRKGEPVAMELEGFPAVVVQHECDHLDGVLFVDRCDTSTLAFLKEYRRFGPLDEFGLDDEDELMDEAAPPGAFGDDGDDDERLDDDEDTEETSALAEV